MKNYTHFQLIVKNPGNVNKSVEHCVASAYVVFVQNLSLCFNRIVIFHRTFLKIFADYMGLAVYNTMSCEYAGGDKNALYMDFIDKVTQEYG